MLIILIISYTHMAIFLENVLDVHTIEAITDTLADNTLFEDGRKTAGKTARLVKKNLQANPKSPAVKGAAKLVEKALLANTVFKQAALPVKFAKIMFNRYDPGMTYGSHMDDAIIANTRTDLSFTLFLSDPESYQGGELVLERNDGNESVKLPKGALYLYSANALHYVAPVTSGYRLAAVGWVQSRVRLAEHREILFDLYTALQQLPRNEQNQSARLNIIKAQNNIMRLWAD